MATKNKSLSVLLNGIIKENPLFVLVLGTCPSLATTTSVSTAIGMGLAATFVLIGSNIIISMLKKAIPKKVRIPAYIIIIAGFVTIVSLLIKALLPELDKSLGIFLPLIVVNCIILGRAEAFASKNTVWHSALDGVGMGLGFTLALFLISSVREILGSGAWLGFKILPEAVAPMGIFSQAPADFTLGILMALVGVVLNFFTGKKIPERACDGCPARAACTGEGNIDRDDMANTVKQDPNANTNENAVAEAAAEKAKEDDK